MSVDIAEAALGDVLTRSEEWIDLEPDGRYRQVTVRLWGKGVVQRDEVSGVEIAAQRRLAVRAGQFILSRIDARNGAFGIVPDALDGAVVSNDFPVFTPNPARILPAYLGWLSRTRRFVDLCKAASEGTTNRVRLNEARFLAMTIPLPPLDEQRRIVARIEELAGKIEEARGLRRQAVEEARAFSHSHLDEIYEATVAACDATKLEDVCLTITDGDHLTPTFSDEGVKFIFVGNVSSGYLHFNGCKHVTRDYYAGLRDYRKPRRGDVLYSAVGATLGIPAIVDHDEEFCFQRHVALIRPNRDKVASKYLWYMLRTGTLYRTAWAEKTGSAQPTVPLRAIRALPIPVPPLPDQQRIVAYLDDLQTKMDALKRLQAETAAELDALLPALLDKAFKGEL